MPKLRLVFYGDDFTGSADSLEVLATAGMKCALFLGPPCESVLTSWGGFDAIGIAGDSRSMSPAEMDIDLPGTFEQIKHLAPDIVHYKVCSTFDSSARVGSIGHAISIGCKVFETPLVPVVAGNPALKRYCIFGNLFAHAQTDHTVHRIDRHPVMSVHPITPMTEPDMALHIQAQHEMSFARLDITQLDGGVDLSAITAELAKDHDALLIDGATTNHLTVAGSILQGMANVRAPLFTVGSSGVEYGLTQFWRKTGVIDSDAAISPSLKAAKQVIVVSGSASPLSRIQIENGLEAGYHEVSVDAASLLSETEGQAYEAHFLETVIAALQAGLSPLIHTAKGPDDPRINDMILAMGTKSFTREEAKIQAGKLLAISMGRLVKRILKIHRPDRLVTSGGDTSSQIIKILAPEALVIDSFFSRGAPLCKALSSKPFLSGLEIALKGGQMGDKDYFIQAIEGIPAPRKK
ncbi:four-carbon acid sugar kinase family protein [Pseudomonas tolaasii]